jgi:hypothetical protein
MNVRTTDAWLTGFSLVLVAIRWVWKCAAKIKQKNHYQRRQEKGYQLGRQSNL